jgi:hypothetical protein
LWYVHHVFMLSLASSTYGGSSWKLKENVRV